MLTPLCFLAFQDYAPSKLTPLPAAVRPIDPLRELAGAKIISQTGYTLPGQPKVGRVFRYSIRGDVDGFLRKLSAGRRAKDGWKIDRRSGSVAFFESQKPLGRVVLRSFLIQQARIVPDPQGRVGIRVIPASKAPGWIWISYNEHVSSRP